MNLPSIDDYINALHFEGALGQYANLEPVKKPDGSLTFSSGNFAVVFKMKNKNTGKHFALKVFHRYQEGRKESYQLISECLSKIESPYLVKYNYLEKEIWVNSALAGDAEYPAIIMDWVEGQTLGQVLQTLCSTRNQHQLKILAYHFDEMALWLLSQEFAHGDLKSDNILVLNDGSLKLVDYDGLYTPAMDGQAARENGSPHFRHPKRNVQHFGPYIDDFSLLLLSLSIYTLAENPNLISQHGAGDSILFTESELNQPGLGHKWQSLTAHLGNATIAPRYALLHMACASPAHLRIMGLEPILKSSLEQGTINAPQLISSIVENGYEVDKNAKMPQKTSLNFLVSGFSGKRFIKNGEGNLIESNFSFPKEIAIDSFGNLFFTEQNGKMVYKITKDGRFSIFAGNEIAGYQDGNGGLASFNGLCGIAVDASGNVFVADSENYVIRKISPNGLVSTFAGSGNKEYKNGRGASASFSSLRAIAIDVYGNLFITDSHSIRKITPDGLVSTFAGNENKGNEDGIGVLASFNTPNGIAIDSFGNLFVTDHDNFIIRKITKDGVVSKFEARVNNDNEADKGVLATFKGFRGIAIDTSGNIYVSDIDKHNICKINPDGIVTPFAGDGTTWGYNGKGTGASLGYPCGIAVDTSENLFVVEWGNSVIRKITPDGWVSSFAGDYNGEKDGQVALASFNGIGDIATDPFGNLFVTNRGNNTIRKISQDGWVSTMAGNGTKGNQNGKGRLASFNAPTGIAADALGNLFIADSGNHTIRKISADGSVSTFAGSGNEGNEDGWGVLANFNQPHYIAIDSSGNLFISDLGNHTIRKITPDGLVTTFAGNGYKGNKDGLGTLASFNRPWGIAVDSLDNIFVADLDNKRICKITQGGLVSTLELFRASYDNKEVPIPLIPMQFINLTFDSTGNIYGCFSAGGICKITPDGVVNFLKNESGRNLQGIFFVIDALGNFYSAHSTCIEKLKPI